MGSRLEKKSNEVRKRIESHTFDNEEGEEYGGSEFGGFGDYFRRKKIKLQNLDAELRSQSADKPQIFRGIVAHVNGYTQPSLNDLHKLVVAHGGGFLQYLDGKTVATHIIASSLTPKKAVEFKKYRIVKPAWVVDSIGAGKLLPWSSYRVLDEGPGQKVLGFEDNGKIVNQTSKQKKGYRDQTDASWYTERLKGTPTSQPSGRLRFLQESSASVAEDEIFDNTEPPNVKRSILSSHQSFAGPETKASALLTTEKVIAPTNMRNAFMPETQTEDIDDDIYAPVSYQSTKSVELQSANDLDLHARKGTEVLDERQSIKRSAEDNPAEPAKRTKLTAEEHNAILLADPQIRKSTVVNPGFLEQFYKQSRLHHLSTWKADLKSELQSMADQQSASQKTRRKLPPGARRYVLHVDFDSFFAAVSLKKHPEYKDKPVVIAHGNGNGAEIASCNYPARVFGIKNGMWMKKAQELCPEVKVLPYDFPAYEEASRGFYEIIIATGGTVQSVSVDEALVDITSLCVATGGSDGIHRSEGSIKREQSKADTVAQKLRDEVKDRTGCAVSVGIGGNILLAKLALRKAKPAGQYQITPDDVLDFIGPLAVRDLPGVAYSIGSKLEELGIKFVRDVREVSKEKLISALGPKTGEKLSEYSRGIDRKEVGDVETRKSVSAEVNWGVRFENQGQVDEFIENLCGELNRRLLKENFKGKQLTLKVMKRSANAPLDPPKHLGHGKCDTFSKSVALGVATNAKEILTKETLLMLKSLGFSVGELRGIGIQMTKLEPIKAGFDKHPDGSQKRLQFKGDASRKSMNEVADDPIEEAMTPEKPKDVPGRVAFGAAQLNEYSPSRKPLNVLGTQFIMPTQVDHRVLAELPEDVRSKLTRKISKGSDKPKNTAMEKDSIPKTLAALPNQSQVDTESFNALPPDVQEEILSFYRSSPPTHKPSAKTLHPQSPRANRIGPPLKNPQTTPTKPRGRGRTRKTDVKPIGNATLTQSNFITSRLTRRADLELTAAPDTDTDTSKKAKPTPAKKPAKKNPVIAATTEAEDEALPPDGVDAEFLAALPADLRREVLEEQRRVHRHKEVNREIRARRRPNAPKVPLVKQTLALPPRPPRPTFTSRKLCALPKLRDAISDWVREFRDEGPYREDVDALAKYLARVVGEERDMDKGVACVKWLAWLVEEGLDRVEGPGKRLWRETADRVGLAVQAAVKERGLGRVNL